MPKMYVCGDSYMSPSNELPDTHFSEIIAKHLNYELVIYSRGGMSNLGICLQIEAAINEKADFVLLNTTTADRLEIPINEGLKNYESLRGFYHYTVQNIVYAHPQSLSANSGLMNKEKSILISDTLFALLKYSDSDYNLYEKFVDKNSDFIKNTIKNYFEFIYDVNWKYQTDTYCVYAALHKLYESKIPFLIVFDHLNIKDKCSWLNNATWLRIDTREFKKPNYDPGYHTTPKDQEIIANIITGHIKKHNFFPI